MNERMKHTNLFEKKKNKPIACAVSASMSVLLCVALCVSVRILFNENDKWRINDPLCYDIIQSVPFSYHVCIVFFNLWRINWLFINRLSQLTKIVFSIFSIFYCRWVADVVQCEINLNCMWNGNIKKWSVQLLRW